MKQTFDRKTALKQFGNMAGLVLNSSSVLRLSFCTKLKISRYKIRTGRASKSATSPN